MDVHMFNININILITTYKQRKPIDEEDWWDGMGRRSKLCVLLIASNVKERFLKCLYRPHFGANINKPEISISRGRRRRNEEYVYPEVAQQN